MKSTPTWFFATAALKKIGGSAWSKWTGRIRSTLERNIHKPGTGARAGSLDPNGTFGRNNGGRVMTTAFCALCLALL